jgi:ABC-type oligopeptide transport system ATPase subunit
VTKIEKLQRHVERLGPRPPLKENDDWLPKIMRMLSNDERFALERAFVSRDKERNADEKVWIEQLPPDQQAVVRRVHSLLQEFGVEAK